MERLGYTCPRPTAYHPKKELADAQVGVNWKTRTMPVELDVRDPREELVPGTFCEVGWPIHRTYATLCSRFGGGKRLDRTFVIRVANNRTEWVDVKTGVRAGNLIEAFGDLHPRDAVAIHGTDQLRAAPRYLLGLPVQITDPGW